MKFSELIFKELPNGNSLCTVDFSNKYSVDIIKLKGKELFKIKPFETVNGRKMQLPYFFDSFQMDYPIASKPQVVILLREVSNHETERDLEEDEELTNLEEE